MTTSLSLRGYQSDAVNWLADEALAGRRELALISPTGSGKTVMLTALLARLRRHFIGGVVTVPSVQIEANYTNDAVFDLTAEEDWDTGISSVGCLDAQGMYQKPRGLSRERRKVELDSVLAGVDKSLTGWVYITTHQQLVEWSEEGLPADLTGRLLVVDEAHHAAEEATQLGSYAAAWRSRGGATLYLTATPYRSDGHEVLSPDAAKFTHSIAKHAASGYAPSDFRVKTAALGVEVDDIEGWRGDALPEGEVAEGHGYEAILAQWEADGRPKAVFIVPGNRDSRSWAKRLISALPAGVNAFDAVGEESSKADDLQELLNYERGVRRFSDSVVDVIVACRRFDEGTDWPLCSAVYCVGVPRSFGLVAQRWGRSFRDKSGIAGYPEEHRNVAQITFLLAKLTAKGLEKFKGDHHEYAMLLGVYLADHEIGRLVGRQWDRRDPKGGALGKSRRERVRDEQREVLDDRQCAEVQLRLVREAAQFEEAEGRARTPEEWGEAVDAIEDPVERREAGRVVARWLATGTGVGDEDRARLAGMLPGTGINPVYRELFREAIQGVGAVAVDIVGMVARVMSQFTGEDATGVVERIRGAVDWTATEEEVRKAAERWKEKHGKWPTQGTKGLPKEVWDAVPDGTRWVHVDLWLRYGSRGLPGDSSLPLICGSERGLWTTTEEEVRQAVTLWHKTHGEWPRRTDGDAATVWPREVPYGVSAKWNMIEQWLRRGFRGLPGGSSLNQVVAELSGVAKREEYDYSLSSIQAAGEAHHKATGSWPADKTSGFWGGVGKRLREGTLDTKARTVREFFGGERIEFSELTPDLVGAACVAFNAEHGRYPTNRDKGPGFAPSEFGLLGYSTWQAVDGRLHKQLDRGLASFRPEWFTLQERLNQRRLVNNNTEKRTQPRYPETATWIDNTVEAMRAYAEHHGQPPTNASGDATSWFGFSCTWGGINSVLRNRGSSLSALKEQFGIHNPNKASSVLSPEDFNEERVRAAAAVFQTKHGRFPNKTDGDAATYFGYPLTWETVHQRLLTGRGLPQHAGGLVSFLSGKPRRGSCVLELQTVVDETRRYILEHGVRPASVTKGDLCGGFPWAEAWKVASRAGTSLKQIAWDLHAAGEVSVVRQRWRGGAT